MSQSVLVVGSLHFDMMVNGPRLPRLGETLPGDSWSSKCGGKGSNQAVEAARHKATVAMIGCVGDDDMGRQLIEHLSHGSVNIQSIKTVKNRSGLSVVISEASGDYAAVIVSGANQSLCVSDLRDVKDLFASSSIIVLQNEVPEEVNIEAARLAKRGGAKVIWNAAPARPVSSEIKGLIDILVVNAIEAEMLGSNPVNSLATAMEAAVHLAPVAPSVIVTAGEQGLAVNHEGAVYSLPSHNVRLISTHGAGDAFVGALAARLAHKDIFHGAVSYANAAAAVIVSTPEDQRGMLSASDVYKILNAA